MDRHVASVFWLLLLSPYSAAETVTFNYSGIDSQGVTVEGTFGYDTGAMDINNNIACAVYLTGFINGTVTGGTADGFTFNLDLSGEQTEGHIRSVVCISQPGSLLWMNEVSQGGVGEFRRLQLESTLTPVFNDKSLPTELNVGDWPTKQLDVRSLSGGFGLFDLTAIDRATPVTGQFGDVPTDYWAFSFIETLASSGITAGCGGGNYCPSDPVTRAQMAVFLERGINGANYNPPAAAGNVFLDVDSGDFAAAWIEKLFSDGITSGCGGNNYCPSSNVTRDQMAVFLLRAKYGSSYSPPAASGVFGDVPLNHWAVHWIERLAAEGITAGCGGGNYCPDATVTRDQMAVFLVRTFGL